LQVVQVAALEVQNVRKAINRYGTLPKGARIGAYLESLRQSGMTEGQSNGGGNSSGGETPPSQRSGSPRSRVQQQIPGHMIRSNSSGGFQHHHPPPSSPRGTRNNRAPQPTLADLEFPPPPPPEDLEPQKQVPSEEPGSRFGVNLRKREPSTDSCSSAKSEPARRGSRPKERPPSPPSQSPSQETKSPVSEETPPPPPSPPQPLKGIVKEMMELKLVNDVKERSAPKGRESPHENTDSTQTVDFKANLRKVSVGPETLMKPLNEGSSFKAQLKKFELKKEPEEIGSIVDLKSRLRKVDGPLKPIEDPPPKGGEEEEEGDDKRKSTGSISSLKKLWEGESSPPEVVRERRVWPPEEKPAVPIKPNVKPKTPAIYATPGVLASVMEIFQALETSLISLKSASSVTSASWLQLSDKVGLFQSSCLSYVDSTAPPHTRFHLRELLTRLEDQARLLRSAGSRNMADNSKTLSDLHNTLKDVINAVQR
jgi:abelson tyrosine-protein kinase 1